MIIPLLYLLAGGLSMMMLVQGLQRKVDLLSTRNIYLVGFIIYQIISPIMALKYNSFFGFKIIDPQESAKWLVMFVYIYVGIFLLSYHRIRLADWLTSKFSFRQSEGSDSLFTSLTIVLIFAAVVVRVVGVQIPLVRAVSVNIAVAFAAAACALAGWVWGHRRMNPAVLSIVVVALGVGTVVALTGFYSRRPLISIYAGFAWGAYFRWARQLKPSRMLFALSPLVALGIIVVGAFTAVRGGTVGSEATVTLSHMQGADLSAGTTDLLSGQSTGAIMLWVLEKYPTEIEYNHLGSAKYLVQYFIPRMLWEDKPLPYSSKVARIAKLRGVNQDIITLPPGVVGYAAAEGGFYALVIYGLFFGQFLRFFDELIRRNPTNPFIILPIGCTVGQYLGLARGDIAVFTDLAIIGFISSYMILYLARVSFGKSAGGTLAPMPQYG